MAAPYCTRKNMSRAGWIFYLALALYGTVYFFSSFAGLSHARGTEPPAAPGRGAYLARAGDCIYCHTKVAPEAERKPFAGGFPMHSPFGTIYSTNITPDPEYGIGKYTLEEFTRVMRRGITRDGHRLYPAMPYTSFTDLSDEDIAALYDYFMHEVKPIHYQPQATKLAFPFNQRWGLWLWDAAFASDKRFTPKLTEDAAWNRGAYLVEGLGHCSACHTPRGLAYEEKFPPGSSRFLSGGIVDNWFAANLSQDDAGGLGRWANQDIIAFLKTGHSTQGDAFGSMKDVVENSTQYLSNNDVSAMARYLKTRPLAKEDSSYSPDASKAPGLFERPGAGIFASACARCHGMNGEGTSPHAPKLAGNSVVLSTNALSLIRIVLEGGKTANLVGGPQPEAMPAFAGDLTDAEIAQVLTYVRQSWGNKAGPVSERDVSELRKALSNQSGQ